MTTTVYHPPFTPPQARLMTIGELAENYKSLKPVRGNLRVTFEILRFHPSGVLRSIKETSTGQVEMTVSITPLRQRKYLFGADADPNTSTRCWVWSPMDERTPAAVGAAGA